MCSKAVVLQKGQIAFRGEPDMAIDFYTDMQAQIEAKRIAPAKKGRLESLPPPPPADKAKAAVDQPTSVHVIRDTRFGVVAVDRNRIARADHYWMADGKPANVLDTCRPATFHFEVEFLKPAHDLEIGILLWDEKGNRIAPITTEMEKLDILKAASGTVRGTAMLSQFSLVPGRYTTTLAISEKGVLLYRNVLEQISAVASVRPEGVVRIPVNWQIESS